MTFDTNSLPSYFTNDNNKRFNAQKVFLTYPQTPKTFDQERLLFEISNKADVQDYLISQEQHEDGGYHLHAYFKFQKKLDSRSMRFFDITFYNKNHHPNIQKPKTSYKLYRYIKKDNNYITNMKETRPPWEILYDDYTDMEEYYYKIMTDVNSHKTYIGWQALEKLIRLRNQRLSIDEGHNSQTYKIEQLKRQLHQLIRENKRLKNANRHIQRGK